MRRLSRGLAVATAAATMLIAWNGQGHARLEYPWCAMLPMFQAGPAQLCHFMTLEQCRAEVLGTGGHCNINPYYRGPDPRVSRETPPHPRVRSPYR